MTSSYAHTVDVVPSLRRTHWSRAMNIVGEYEADLIYSTKALMMMRSTSPQPNSPNPVYVTRNELSDM